MTGGRMQSSEMRFSDLGSAAGMPGGVCGIAFHRVVALWADEG